MVLFDLDETILSTSLLRGARHGGQRDLSQITGYAGLSLHNGMHQTLWRVARQVRLGIVTSAPRWYLDQILTTHLPGVGFEVTVTFDDVKELKPDPEPLVLALERAGLGPERVVYVGDDLVDHAVCATVGVAFLGAGWVETPSFPSAATVLRHPADLLAYLEGVAT